MNLLSCPDRESLERLLLGRLATDLAEQLEEHLLQCDACSATADTITTSDAFTDAIRSRRVFADDEDVLAQVIEHGKQLRAEVETVQSEETLAVDMRKQREHAADASPANADTDDKASYEPIDFLHPAERPDEIGRLGGYRVLEVMGVGGMGVVFRAEDPKLERLVALKAMKPTVAASKSAKDRFLREAKATASIDDDNIVHIYQVGEDRSIPFIAMQFLRGESLQSRLKHHGRLDQLDVVRIGREVAIGLAAAHRRDLIHRDIKPDNIWIEEETGRAKILDFGLVRSVRDDAGLTQSGMVLGTPRYMAPEQAQGQEVDHRGDLFSLGSVLYHLASGKAPFEGGNLTATLIAVAHKEAEPIDKARPKLNADLANLIMRLLNKDIEGRPQSAVDVAKALDKIEKQIEAEQARLAEKRERQAAEETMTTAKPIPKSLQPQSQFENRKPILIGGALATVAIGLMIALWAAGIIFKVETKDGTLVVKVTGDDFATSVQGKKITIQNTKTNDKVTIDLANPEQTKKLPPGEYKFLLTNESGLNTRTNRFTISSGKNEQVEVWWEPKALDVGKTAPATPTNYALAFDGVDDYVEIPTLGYDGTHPVTIEAVVNASKFTSATLVSFGQRIGLVQNFSRAAASVFISENHFSSTHTKTSTLTQDESTHLAIVYDGQRPRIYVNGSRYETVSLWFNEEEGDLALPLERRRQKGTMLGCVNKDGEHPGFFAGQIDAVRISNYSRYTADFKPSDRLDKDDRTLALYDFDEGSGDVLKDSSGNGHHGKIVGAKWVNVGDQGEASAEVVPSYKWPKDQPAPAVAPFTAEEAKQRQRAWADYLGLPVTKKVAIGQTSNDEAVQLTFVLIPPGEFQMGSDAEEVSRLLAEAKAEGDELAAKRISEEGPQHLVRTTRPFYLGQHEVTQRQWQAVVGGVPANKSSDAATPVDRVSSEEIEAMVTTLNEGSDPEFTFSLPTEAQWEFACRAGAESPWFFGEQSELMKEYGWCRENAGGEMHPVGQLSANAFGLFDMYGNVEEWCLDWAAPGYFDKSPINDPIGQMRTSGYQKVVRGGSWKYEARNCRSAARWKQVHQRRFEAVGFRLAMLIDTSIRESRDMFRVDPDRQAAEWAFKQGGYVVTDELGRVDQSRDLPESFHLTAIVVQSEEPIEQNIASALPKLESLTRLEISTPNWSTPEILAEVAKCPKLTTLTARGQTLETLQSIAEIKSLAELDVAYSKITDDDLSALAGLSQVTRLSLAQTPVTGKGLVYLKNWRQLKHLDLGTTQVTAEGLRALKHLPHLELLELRKSQLASDEYSVLKHCPNLISLTLLFALIDDTGLKIVAELKQLRELDLRGTQVTARGIDELKRSLPQCKIIWDGATIEPKCSNHTSCSPCAQPVHEEDS